MASDAVRETLVKRYIEHGKRSHQSVGLLADSRVVQVKNDASNALKELDYSTRLDTVEVFQDEVYQVSPKQVTNVINTARPGTCISITGTRGVGKTTFIQRMCHCWVLGYCLWKYKYLISIDLSTTPDEPLTSLSQLLSTAFSSMHEVHASECQLAIKQIEKLNGQGVLIILDHFKNDLHSELLSNILRLKNIIVVVSSFQAVKKATVHFQMLGLTDKQISQNVLQHYHYDQSRSEAFFRYLSSVPHLSYLKKIPVYLLGLLAVFESIPNTYQQKTLVTFLACLAIIKFSPQEEIKHHIQKLDTMPISEFLKSLLLPVGQQFQYLYSNDKLLLNRGALWMHSVHVALPLRSGELFQLTKYPLLYDLLASLHLCSLQQPLEETLSHLSSHKELLYFTILLSPQIQREFLRQKKNNITTAYIGSYDSDITPRCDMLEAISVSSTALSARTMYTLISGASKLDFSRCSFSPGAAAILTSSIGSGSSIQPTEPDHSIVKFAW